MTYQEELKTKLEQFKDFRERRFRAKYLSVLTLRKIGLEMKYKENRPLTLDELADFAKIYDSYRHEYDAVLKEYPHLRGSDYADKDIYEQAKQVEFGYYPGYHQDVKSLKALV